MVRVAEHAHLADVVPGGIARVPGVRDTTTHIAFRSYSGADVESGFSIGAE